MNSMHFERWAPADALWSPWAKPVLFASHPPLHGGAREAWEQAREAARALVTPSASREMALVLDVQGPLALAYSLECAARGGWRPVPLVNSCPGLGALVDNEPIRAGLEEGAALLERLALPASAPPAFVLDSRRKIGEPKPERFDNRWVVFPQDFPSAARLAASGVRRACLVQHGRSEARDDLAHVLLRWQRAGIEIVALDLAAPSEPTPLAVKRPRGFRAFGYRVLVALGLRRSSAGGFGALIPPAAAGGGAMWA